MGDFHENVLGFVSLASEIVKRAMDEINSYRSMQKKANALIDGLTKQLGEVELILPTEKTAAAAMLADPVASLGLMSNLIDRFKELRTSRVKEASEPGRAVTDGSREAYNSVTSNYVGEKTSQQKESDRRYIDGLGAVAHNR